MTRESQGDRHPLRAERRMAQIYIVGLLLIAGLAIATHALIDALVAAETAATRVVDIAGGQRMLSQRIGLLSLELAHADTAEERTEARRRLEVAAETMHKAHVGLLEGDPSLGLPGLKSWAVDQIYFDPPHRLDRKVRTYIGAARGFAQLPTEMATPDSSFLEYLIGAPEHDLLRSQKAVVTQYVTDSRLTIRNLRVTLWGLLAALLITIALEGLFIFRPAFQKLLARTRELYNLARTDPLTGSHNRRSFTFLAEAEHERVKRYGHPCSVVMLDIDHFKLVNDTYGHHIGDQVIRGFAACCVENLRRSDLFGRLGGEEFAAVLPETTLSQAMAVAEKLRAAVAAHRLPLPAGGFLTVTTSVGVATLRADDEAIYDALNRADRRLYEAKQAGRNRVAGPPLKRSEGATASAFCPL